MTKSPMYIHATAILVHNQGLLLQGESGTGKTSLALALLDHAQYRGIFARLVGDDRVEISRVQDQLFAAPHPQIAGWVERRGYGMTPIPYLNRAPIDVLITCQHVAIPRLPQPSEQRARLLDMIRPHISVERHMGPDYNARHILAILNLISSPSPGPYDI